MSLPSTLTSLSDMPGSGSAHVMKHSRSCGPPPTRLKGASAAAGTRRVAPLVLPSTTKEQ